MDSTYERGVIGAFDALYAAVSAVSTGSAGESVTVSLAALRDAFLNALKDLPDGTDITSMLDIDRMYGLMEMLASNMDVIAAEEDDEEGWNRFMDAIRNEVSGIAGQ